MRNLKKIKLVSFTLIISVFLCCCSKSQNNIDDIIPDYARRTYSIADLLPYTYKEIKNAQAYYGQELTKYFYANTSTEAEVKRVTNKEKIDFYIDIGYRNHNYKMIKKRYAMFFGNDNMTDEEMEKERKEEYDKYYKINNAEGIDTIKKYNDGKAFGMPLMSIKVLMDTATISETEKVEDAFVSTAMCEIYKPVTITCDKYDKLKFGDTVELKVPEKVYKKVGTDSEIETIESRNRVCTYIATDSLMYKNDDGRESYYYIGCVDGTNDVRRICDAYGKTLEIYVETKPLSFIKYCRVVCANEPMRLTQDMSLDRLEEYAYNDIAERALCGGYLVAKYKDYIYANQITTDRKGYITSLIDYNNLCIDNEFRKSLSK